MAYYFNGATHQIIRSDAVVGTWPITMHGRVKLRSSDSNDHLIVGVFASGSDQGFYLRTSFTGGTQKARISSRDGSSNNAATTSTSLTVGQWHSVVAEVTGAASRQVWIDNAGNGASITSISPGTLGKTSIGAYDNNGTLSANVDHDLADIAIWDVALTSDERAALAQGYSPAFIRPASLKLYVPLIRGGGDRRGGAFTVNNATVSDHPRVLMRA